jgi:two-component system cell cycle response regulator DivK
MAKPAEVVLVVEDHEANCQLTCKILNHIGLQTVVRSNGEEALEWCRAFVPRLILMDISLPGMDGLEVTRRLRAMPEQREVPILALTAHALGDWEEQTRAAGCTAYYAKPLRPRDLVAAVTRYLNLPLPPPPPAKS